MCGKARCHGEETNCFSSTSLDVPNALPQPVQNLTVKLVIDGLTRGYEFLVDNDLDVEKTINMYVTLLRTWRAFFSAALNLATPTATTVA
jgi:hypothetical protein